MTHPKARIIQRRTVFIVQEKKGFLFWHYWANAFTNLITEDGADFDSIEKAQKKYDELVNYFSSPKKQVLA